MANFDLLNSTSRVETPFIKIVIGGYTFGVYDNRNNDKAKMAATLNNIQYPNYVKSLSIDKVNGKLNKYTLVLAYPITPTSDPNFFEKVFSSVSESRKITFSYGDLSLPSFCYRDETAIITKVSSQFSINSSLITYTVNATSSSLLKSVGNYSFREREAKPSDVIKELLYGSDHNLYGLQDLFYGMRDKSFVETQRLIPGDDAKVKLNMKTNISILDYLSYLVSCMSSLEDSSMSLIKNSVYVLTIVDDTSSKSEGPYFKILKSTKGVDNLETYQIDIGYPSQNIVTSFQIQSDDSYSILYNYSNTTGESNYKQIINDKGELEYIYAPTLTSSNAQHTTTESEKIWWTKITNFPIQATLEIKGLLRPAILMTYVRINVYFYGRKHISSGLYVVTKQTDNISENGFKTTLALTKISGDLE